VVNAAHRFDNEKRYRDNTHDRQRMLTPKYILEPISSILGGIGLDPCTEPDNPTGAQRFFAPPTDGLVWPWTGVRNVFCNPPYGKVRLPWVKKCIDSGRQRPTVLLIPAHTETQIVQLALRNCTTVCFVQGRLRFRAVRKNNRKEAASHGSMIIGFGDVDLTPLCDLGVVFSQPIAISSNPITKVAIGE